MFYAFVRPNDKPFNVGAKIYKLYIMTFGRKYKCHVFGNYACRKSLHCTFIST